MGLFTQGILGGFGPGGLGDRDRGVVFLDLWAIGRKTQSRDILGVKRDFPICRPREILPGEEHSQRVVPREFFVAR